MSLSFPTLCMFLLPVPFWSFQKAEYFFLKKRREIRKVLYYLLCKKDLTFIGLQTEFRVEKPQEYFCRQHGHVFVSFFNAGYQVASSESEYCIFLLNRHKAEHRYNTNQHEDFSCFSYMNFNYFLTKEVVVCKWYIL